MILQSVGWALDQFRQRGQFLEGLARTSLRWGVQAWNTLPLAEDVTRAVQGWLSTSGENARVIPDEAHRTTVEGSRPKTRRRKPDPDTDLVADLVLEGGGVKGIGLVGAYSVLAEQGYLVDRVAGTSAGAIVGALIAAGMPLQQLEATMREVDYVKFKDRGCLDRLGLAGKGLSVLLEKGVYEGDHLRSWLDGLLTDLGARTFGDLRTRDRAGSSRPERAYQLVVMCSDVTRGRLVRFPWDYHLYGLKPDEQLVADAVRASMSIPFFYEPVRLQGRGGRGEETTSYLVDGAMLSNFPIDVFDRTDGRKPRYPTFGLKLSARPAAAQVKKFEIMTTADFAQAMVGTMTNFHDQMHIDDESVLARTVFIDTFAVSATDFDLDEATQRMLFDSGRHAASEFLAKWDFKEYVDKYRTRR